jgi:hypothetical protein
LPSSFRNAGLAFVILTALLGCEAHADDPFVTIEGDAKSVAWWVLAEFHPFTRDVRGIPVEKIRKNWCKATEFRKDLMPRELLFEYGTDAMEGGGLSFAIEGSFDGSGSREVALVGVYEECGGQRGRFILILDLVAAGQPKIRFVEAVPTAHQFGALSREKDNVIAVWSCMECDGVSKLKWDRKRRKFAWLPDPFE